jgi:Flp pilus assembly pilin Flp
MLAAIKRFARAETGIASFEVGLVIAGVAVAAAMVLASHGSELPTALERLKADLPVVARELAKPTRHQPGLRRHVPAVAGPASTPEALPCT